MKILLIITFFFSKIIFAGILQGVVLNKQTKKSLQYVDVILKGANIETITDSTGHFRINDIPDGEYTLSIPTMFYEKYGKVITFDSTTCFYDLKILLEKVVPYVPRDSLLEEYHSKLSKFNSNELLKITIDSIKRLSSSIEVYSTFKNLSDYPIYILRTIDFINPCEINIYTKEKQFTSRTKRFIDNVGMKTYPDSTDFITIAPHSEISYPVVEEVVKFITCSLKEFEVTLTYNYKRPKIIGGAKFTQGAESFLKKYKKTFYYLNSAFRGKVESERFKIKN